MEIGHIISRQEHGDKASLLLGVGMECVAQLQIKLEGVVPLVTSKFDPYFVSGDSIVPGESLTRPLQVNNYV